MAANVFQTGGDIEIKNSIATPDMLRLINYLVYKGFEYIEDWEYPYALIIDNSMGTRTTLNHNNELINHIHFLGGGSCSFEEYTISFFEQLTSFEDNQLVQNILTLLTSLTAQNTKLTFNYKEVDLEENTCTNTIINVTSDPHQPFNINTHVESSKPHTITIQDLKYVEYPDIDDFYEKHELDEDYTVYYADKYEYDAWIKSITPEYYNPKTDQFENKDGKILAYNPDDEMFVISN